MFSKDFLNYFTGVVQTRDCVVQDLTLNSIGTRFNMLAVENIMGKEEITRNERFLLFPQGFLLKQIIPSLFVHIFAIISLFAAELDEPKICIRGKGLTVPK